MSSPLLLGKGQEESEARQQMRKLRHCPQGQVYSLGLDPGQLGSDH